MHKEVNYVFEFTMDGETQSHVEYHYIDGYEKRRYRWITDGDGGFPQPLDFKGTEKEFKTIKPVLLDQELVYENSRGEQTYNLIYDLTDVDVVVILPFTRYYMGDRPYYEFGFSNFVYKFKFKEDN
ncbi:hypothetical protein [Halalkalibacterium halodurans]|uniref:Uncharacterized protein n=1 Tax=Halalkalibacterium halodurans TaxID=86665 RepID=A0A0M0KNS5_ALKHA|nr:hypothetical protein [Halalkalibacterium halodurans]TPE67970.1 hypothetical protein AMD02_015940 [Halalkalibacterium halodurans]